MTSSIAKLSVITLSIKTPTLIKLNLSSKLNLNTQLKRHVTSLRIVSY
jgi:hypothetical protein